MAEPQVLTTLKRKKSDIERAILGYEKRIKAARRDLSHINASIRLFAVSDNTIDPPAYVDLHRLFRRGELMDLCKEQLAKKGPLTTRQLATHVIKAKGFDKGDNILRSSLTYRIVQALRMQWKRGQVERLGKVKGVLVWGTPQISDSAV